MRSRFVFLAVSIALLGTLVAFSSGAVEVAGKGLYSLAGLFGKVLQLVRTNYVEEVGVDRLQQGSIEGLVQAADPGGGWVPDDRAAAFAATRSRRLPAFGLVLGHRASYPFVLQVLAGSPAEKAGMRAGELVERIGEQPVRARPLWLAQVLLDEAEQGRRPIALDVIDRQFEGKRRVELITATVPEPQAAAQERNGIPIVRIPMLDDGAVSRVERVLADLGTRQGLVLDLRGVALGSAESAVRLASMVAGGDAEVRVDRRDGKPDTLKASGPARSWRLVVCTDPTTAGPAEVMVLALKGRAAAVVGGESYGDTGQRRSAPAAGGELWLAESWAVGPDGKPVLGAGLKPDESVRMRKDADPVLDRAVEIARGGAVNKQAA